MDEVRMNAPALRRAHVVHALPDLCPHNSRLLAAVGALLLLSGCQASGPASPTPSPVPPVDYTVRFAG